ncbi:MAG: hypothetical protein DCC55_15345 [Chloroflexi bacterium]|nr:MAG: hypothetical protein DCC55_15345 [Chloroflexota bacterium]
MTTQAAPQAINYEHKIFAIARRLPPDRRSQLLAFARFLAFETFQTHDLDFLEDETDFEDEYTEADARWDAIFESEEGQLTLEKLADEALAEIRAGKARPIVFTADGEIAPG